MAHGTHHLAQLSQLEAGQPTLPVPVDVARGSLDDAAIISVLTAVGEAIGWCGASYWELSPGGSRMLLVDTWRASDKRCERPVAPSWVEHLPVVEWDRRRVTWRSGATTDEGCNHAAVVVPVRCEAEVVGLLTFFGVRLTEPDGCRTALVEAVAALLGRRPEPLPS